MLTVRDMLQTEIQVGDTVAYPTNTTKGLAMGVARVTGIISQDAITLQKIRGDESTLNFTFTHMRRCVVTKGVL